MANQQIVDQLVANLCERGKVVSDSASTTDLRTQLELDCSNNCFKSALNTAMYRGLVVRRRRPFEASRGDDRPITLEATVIARRSQVRTVRQRARASFAL